jgi:hypothetical protein
VQYILITEREAQLGVSGSDIVAGGSVELASVKSVPVAARALYFVAATAVTNLLSEMANPLPAAAWQGMRLVKTRAVAL